MSNINTFKMKYINLTVIIFSLVFVLVGTADRVFKKEILKINSFPNGIGINIHNYTENDIRLLNELGADWARVDLSWRKVESTKGKYEFNQNSNNYDHLIKLLIKYKIKPYFVLGYSNDLYENNKSILTKSGREAFGEFVKVASNRYKDIGAIWEIWNEPNIDLHWEPQPSYKYYSSLVNYIAPIIKRHDSTGTIVAPAVLRIDSESILWLKEVFKRGILENIDAVSVHPYRNKQPESVMSDYLKVEDLIEEYSSKKIPVISGEWGYSTVNLPKEFAREKQADYLVRMLLVNQMMGIPVSIWYGLRDDGIDKDAEGHNYGLIDTKNTFKPSFTAFKVLKSALKDTDYKYRITSKNTENYILKFETKDIKKNVIVYWTTDDWNSERVFINGNKGDLLEINGEKKDVQWKDYYIMDFTQTPKILIY